MKNFELESPNLKFLLVALCCLFSNAYGLPPAAAWESQKTGTFAWLHSVFFLDERRGWAVGGKGVLLATQDGGATWAARPQPTSDTIRDIFFDEAGTGWLVCERNAYEAPEKGGKDEPVSYLMKTEDGGASWSRVEVTRGEDSDVKLVGVRFADSEHGWTFGELGALYATSDGGANWSRQHVPTRHLLLGGAFLDARTGWLSGGGLTVLKTTDGGANWHPGIVFLPAGAESRAVSRRLNGVCFVGRERGWAVGGGGVILSTADGGRTWRPQSSGVGDDLFDVKFFDEREGWAVGSGGAMLHTRDGGRTWAEARRVTAHGLERLAFVGRRAWAVGFGGTVVALKG